MTPTHVIILAQGQQTRMGALKVPKQLLVLPAHSAAQAPNVTILERTLAQVGMKLMGNAATGSNATKLLEPHTVTLVADRRIDEYYLRGHIPLPYTGEFGEDSEMRFCINPGRYTLPDAGNSSLVGLSRFVEQWSDIEYPRDYRRTIILLGDVVYSWACMDQLFRPIYSGEDMMAHSITFCGTSDLGQDRGELWGIAWYRQSNETMANALKLALRNASKHEDGYQPGQLRQLLFSLDDLVGDGKVRNQTRQTMARSWWVPIDDYTMDVDLPEHLVDLARSSLQALADDRERGLCG